MSKDRFLTKQAAKKIHPMTLAVIASWLRDRKAKFVVGGKSSHEFTLEDIVF